MPTPAELGSRLVDEVVVVDVGARWGAGDRWRPFGPRVKVFGFDPDEEECARLAADEPDVTYVPLALGAKTGLATLYRTAEPACSSLYPPIRELTVTRPALRVILDDGEETIQITTLDTWLSASSLEAVHVLKLDTQGSELDVLEGAQDALADVRVLEIEVEFNPIYESQPLFGDVDRFLRDRGFVLWRLSNLAHYGLRDAPAEAVVVEDSHYFDTKAVGMSGGGGQLYWANAFYVAVDALESGPVSEATGVRDACCLTAFGFVDLAAARLRAAGVSTP